MGNSGSHSSKSVLAQNVQHGGHSLPRDLRSAGGGGSSSAIGSGAKQRNGGFKVLPERVPGQKLRMTDNGSVLQNGGTLSGRRLLGGEPDPSDIDFSKMAKRRSADMTPHHHHHNHHHHNHHPGSRSGSRSDYEDGGSHMSSSAPGSRGGAPPKRYHSDPDLLNSPGIISANPEGFRHYGGDPKKQAAAQQHKMRAPPPPHQGDPVGRGPGHASSNYGNQSKEGQSPTKDTNKRIFANFLKPNNKKSAAATSSSSKQDLNNYRHSEQPTVAHPGGGKGDYLAKNKHASLPTPQNNGAEVTSTKFDAKNKSTTYVLERRDHYGSNSVLGGDSVGGAPNGGGGGQSKMRTTTTTTTESSTHNESFSQDNRRFVKNGYSSPSDNRSLLLPSQHPSLQAKLSESSLLHARSIDRSEIRNRALELQKRVRSMESLSLSDDRDVNLNPVLSGSKNQLNERYNRQHVSTSGKDFNASLENLRNPAHPAPLNNGWHGHLARKSSNSSSVLSDNRIGKSPNDKVPLRHRYSGDEPSSVDRSSRLSAPLSPRSPSSDTRHRDERGNVSKIAADSDNFDAYFFGTATKHESDIHHRKQTSDLYLGSLDKKAIADMRPYRHQRTPSDTEIGNSSSRAAHESLLPNDRNGVNLHNLNDKKGGMKKAPSNDNLRRGIDNHELFDHNLQEHLNKSKTKGNATLNELLGPREPRKRDSFAGKMETQDREHVDEHLQESFFLKAREPLNRIVEYSGRMAKPFESSEAQNKTKMADGNGGGGDQSEDEMDINMQLRPTLPKRLQAMPRFSPTQVWRSFSHDELGGNDNKLSDRCSSDGEEGDVFEDRIQRVARPMAPPRGSNEKSADSGISPGAGSPLPLMYDFDAVLVPEKGLLNSSQAPSNSKKNGGGSSSHHYQPDPHYRPPPPISPALEGTDESPVLNNHQSHHDFSHHQMLEPPIRASYAEEKKSAWTPEEDLASDFDAGSGDNHHSPGLQNPPAWIATPIPEMISSQPKLISRKDMFNTRQNFKILDSESRLVSMPIVMDGPDSLQPLSLSPETSMVETTKSGKKIKTGKNGEPQGSPQKYNSVRKLKRSLSGVLQGNARLKSAAAEDSRVNTSLDENWSLSRSLPNSLHNGHDGERNNAEAGGKYSKNRANNGRDKNRHQQQQQHMQQQQQQRLPRSESGPVFVMSRQPASELAHHRQPFSDLEGRSFNDERSSQVTSVTTTPGGATAVRYNRGGHIVYLPKYEAMQIVSENDNDVIFPERRAYSDLGMATNIDQPGGGSNGHENYNDNGRYNNDSPWMTGTQTRGHHPFKKPKKFTYQSTVRQNERIKLEQKLSQEVAIKEHQRNREQELVKKVEEEFQKKRHKEKADIRQQLRILSLESNGQTDPKHYGENLNNSSSFEDEDDELNTSSLNMHPYHNAPPPDERHERAHMSLPPLLIPPEDYDLTVPRNTHHNARITSVGGAGGGHALMGGSSNPNSRRIAHSMYHNPEPIIMPSAGNGHHPTQLTMIPPPASGGSGFFSGIGKWMRRQQRLEKTDGGVSGHSPRQEPEGAPASLGSRYVTSGNGHSTIDRQQNGNSDHRSSANPPSSPYQESRSQAIVGAKFSSGRNPENSGFLQSPGKTSAAPPAGNQRKSIYTHLQEVTEKEDRLRKQNPHPVEGATGIEGRTSSVWISPEKSYVKSPTTSSSSKHGGGFGAGQGNDRNGADFYEMPFDSIPPGMTNGGRSAKYDSQQYDREKDNTNRPYQNNSLQRDWMAGQRHSIAIDTSRGQWGSSGNPAHDHHRQDANRGGRYNDGAASANNRNNGYSSGDANGRRREVGRQDSYRELQEGKSLDYRQNYSEDKGLGPHQRSLSYSQLPEWDGGPSTNRKSEAVSPRSPISRVQPFNPNQVYRPVAFPTGRQPECSNYN